MVLSKRERKGPVAGRLVTAYDNIRQHLEDSIQAEVKKEAEEVKEARDSITSSLKYSLSSPMTIESQTGWEEDSHEYTRTRLNRRAVIASFKLIRNLKWSGSNDHLAKAQQIDRLRRVMTGIQEANEEEAAEEEQVDERVIEELVRQADAVNESTGGSAS